MKLTTICLLLLVAAMPAPPKVPERGVFPLRLLNMGDSWNGAIKTAKESAGKFKSRMLSQLPRVNSGEIRVAWGQNASAALPPPKARLPSERGSFDFLKEDGSDSDLESDFEDEEDPPRYRTNNPSDLSSKARIEKIQENPLVHVSLGAPHVLPSLLKSSVRNREKSLSSLRKPLNK